MAPLSLRALNRLALDEVPPLGYLPALEVRRDHDEFDARAIERLQYGRPAWVFIGDSMLGTRIDPLQFANLEGRGNAAFLYHAATGPSWWYLAFKNQLVASGVKPRCIFFFFRDTNLTDTMWRLSGHYGRALDRVATTWEPELDALVAARTRGAWARIHNAVNRTYEIDIATMWMEPLLRRWFVHWRYPDAESRREFEASEEKTFALEFLRSDVGTDMTVAANPDFARDLPTSVLPLILDLAEHENLHLCFVRVQRRPENGRVPQTPALRRYVAELADYVQSRGASFRDDTEDPEMTLDLYSDGDHVRDRRRYTEIFHRRVAMLLE